MGNMRPLLSSVALLFPFYAENLSTCIVMARLALYISPLPIFIRSLPPIAAWITMIGIQHFRYKKDPEAR